MSKSGGGSKATTTSTISSDQKKLLKTATEFINPKIGQGATPLPFDPTAPPDELFEQAFSQFKDAFNDPTRSARITQGLEDILSGVGTFQPDIDRVSQEFNRTVTTPVSNILRDTLGLDVQNQLNQPGRLFASDTRENVGRAITQELGRSTAPLLAQSIEAERGRGFASQENFLARQQGALTALQSQPITEFQQAFGAAGAEQGVRQDAINRRAAEFLRLTPENDPFLAMALGIATQPTMQTTQTSGGSGSNMGAMLGAGLGLALAAPTGGSSLLAGGGLTGASFQGAAMGGGIGGLF